MWLQGQHCCLESSFAPGWVAGVLVVVQGDGGSRVLKPTSKGQAEWEKAQILLMEVVCNIWGAVRRKPEVLAGVRLKAVLFWHCSLGWSGRSLSI